MRRLLYLSVLLFPMFGDAETVKNSGNTDQTVEVCPKGQVGRFENEVFRCVRGNPEKIARDMQKKLEREGLTYREYMEGLKDMQTTRVGAEAMQYRWEEITGERKTEEQIVKEIIDKTVCPEGYKGNIQGGCEPKESCAQYGCPEGQISSLITDGVNKYCQCRPAIR